MERLGIFGGTFDPPHLGHLILASEAVHQLKLDKVLWVLTPYPPHKQHQIISPIQDRIDMVLAAISDNPCFELCFVDINREPPHYAVDTVKIILNMCPPQSELVYLIGGDSLANLPTWHNPQYLLQLTQQLGVFRRPGIDIDLYQLEEKIPDITKKIQWISAPLIDISASYIRLLVSQKGPYRYYLPEKVVTIIETGNLYLPESE